MRTALRPLLPALLAVALLAGCKKPPPPPAPTPTATPTPVPATDIIAFTRMGQLWGTNWNGTQTRILAAPSRNQALWFPVAAPDGTHFLAWLSKPDGTQNVARVELSGRVTVLTDIAETVDPAMKNLRLANAPALSPDGKRIAYSFNGNLWMMDANGYNAETLISDGASWSPAFAPDGKSLAYVNGTRNKYDLWVADLESRDTWQITDFTAHSVGHPRWSKDGRHLLLTRSQGDESDVVQVLATTDVPLADADLITKDHASSSAVFNPSYNRLVFSTRRGSNGRWILVTSDPTGADVKPLTDDTALSPAWMRPSTQTALVFGAAPSRPTPVVKPTAAAQPTAAPTQAPVQAAPTAAPSQPTPAPPTPVPTQAPAQAAPTAAPSQPTAAPTQPPLKAAPLRLRYKAAFADDDSLSPAALADLRKLAPRVKQYDSSRVQIIGPLDGSALRGRHASQEARSRVRAQAVATALAQLAGMDASKVQAQAYSPATAGSGAPNSIQIYVELK